MKKTYLFVAGLCGVVVAAAMAQEPAKAAGERSPKIAVIDMDRISSDSVLGKNYRTKIEALETEIKTEGTKKQTELSKMDAAIKTLSDELEKQGSVLSPEAADKKRQEVTKKQRDRQAYLEDGQADLQRMRERAEAQAQAYNAEFQQRIKPSIEAVAKEKGVDIILTSQAALTLNRDFDISPDIIARADAAEKTAAAAPKPAPPAPKPPASPKP